MAAQPPQFDNDSVVRISKVVRKVETANTDMRRKPNPHHPPLPAGQPPASQYMVWMYVDGKWIADWPRVHNWLVFIGSLVVLAGTCTRAVGLL